MTEQRRIFLQPTGSVTLNKCILHFLETYNNGSAEQARNAVKVLAITSMIPKVISRAKEMDAKLLRELEVLDTRKDYAIADSYSHQIRKHQLILDKALEIYEMIMQGLADSGITQKKLSEVASNISTEAFK